MTDQTSNKATGPKPPASDAASLTVDQFAARNCMTRPTVYAEINSGRLRSFKVGRLRRISVEAERNWIARLEQEAAA